MFTPSKYSTIVQRKNVADYMDSVASYKNQYNTIRTDNGFTRPLVVGHNRVIHTPSPNLVNNGFNLTTTQDVSTFGCHEDSSMNEDGTMVCGDPVLFPPLNTLKPHHFRKQLTNPSHFESPAKIFAKLKAKAQREMWESEMVGKDYCIRGSKKQSVFKSPKKRKPSTFTIDDIKENKGFLLDYNEAEAITLSPTQLHEKDMNCPYSKFSTKSNPLMSLKDDTGSDVYRGTPLKQPFLNGLGRTPSPISVQSHPITTVNTKKISRPQLSLRDFGGLFQTTNATVLKGLPSGVNSNEDSCRKWVFEEPGILKDGPHSLKKSHVVLERLPSLESPAKLFARMKDRERKRELHVVSQSNCFIKDPRKRHLAFDQCREFATPSKNSDTEEETCMDANSSFTGSAVTASHDNRSVTDASDGAHSIDVRPYSDVVEDPLLLHTSPRISIPKKCQAVFLSKHNAEPTGSRQRITNNIEGIYLMQWILKFNGTGLFVDGIRRDNNMAWHSNVIAERVSSTVVKTVSGSTYCLVGKMASDVCSTFPRWILKKFLFGFPQKWKIYLEDFLAESKGLITENRKRNTGKPAPEKHANSSINQKTLNTEKRKPNNASVSCTPHTVSSSLNGGTKVSRSGRVIKTPLEYWKGGRIILDSDMNVTIHESYNTSTCESQISTPAASRRRAQNTERPASVFLSLADDFRSGKALCTDDVAVPVRKVKVLHRRCQHSDDRKSSTNQDAFAVELYNRIDNHTSPTCASLALTSHTDGAPQDKALATSKHTYSTRSSRESLTSPDMSLQQKQPLVPVTSGSPQGPPRVLHVSQKNQTTRKKTPEPSNDHVASKPLQRSIEQHELITVEKQRSGRGRQRKNRPAAVEQSDGEVQAEGCDSSEKASDSDEDFIFKRKIKGNRLYKAGGTWRRNRTIEDSQLFLTSDSSEGKGKSPRLRSKALVYQTGRSTRAPQPRLPDVLPEGTQAQMKKKKKRIKKVSKAVLQGDEEDNDDNWTDPELLRLHEAVTSYPKNMSSFWLNVAMAVGTRSADECQQQYISQKSSQTSTKVRKKKEAPQKKEQEPPSITARVGTLKRKQQVRQLLDYMPKDDHDDIFNSSPMQNKRVKLPTVSPNDKEHLFMSNDPQTPGCLGFSTAKTPQCLHITPGMMGSVNRNDDDKYIYQLQKRMKKGQANVHKHVPFSKKFTPTPNVKRASRRCTSTENDSFVVWEMFPEAGAATDESGEEQDYYFMDD